MQGNPDPATPATESLAADAVTTEKIADGATLTTQLSEGAATGQPGDLEIAAPLTAEQVAALQAERDALAAERDALKSEKEAAARAQAEAAAEAALAPHAERFTEEGRAVLKNLFLSDPAAAQALLAQKPAPQAAAPVVPAPQPPAPLHDPSRPKATAPDAAARAERIAAIARPLIKAGHSAIRAYALAEQQIDQPANS